MMRRLIFSATGLAVGLLAIVFWARAIRPLADARFLQAPLPSPESSLLTDSTRDSIDFAPTAPVRLPEDRHVPRDLEQLTDLVAWMRSLAPDELHRLSNADFGFRESE